MPETIVYRDEEEELHGLVEWPERPNGAAILIAHEINGIGVNVRQRAQQLAALGYVAFAADHYGKGEVFEGEEATARMNALRGDTQRFRRRVQAGFDTLLDVADVDASKCAAIGYCFGGQAVLELARSGAPVAGVVSFHGIFDTGVPAERGKVRSRVLACTGYLDPLVLPDQIARFQSEMHGAGVDWQLIVYGRAYHAFTNPNVHGNNGTLAYDPSADRQSWAAAQLFLEETLGLSARREDG